MSEENHPKPAKQTLTVLPNSGKVDQLRKEFSAEAAKNENEKDVAKNLADRNVIDMAIDPTKSVQQKLIEGKVIAKLQEIYDPEIPINIYELGLIYEIHVAPETSAVEVKMTLTAPACPVAGSLPGQVEAKIEEIEEVPSAKVELVWDPPWSKDRMSEAALLQLGLL